MTTSSPRQQLSGLYVVTDTTTLRGDALLRAVAESILGGARMVQYRDKSADPALRLKEATALRSLCAEHQVLFLINDDVPLAEAVGADGVHLGREDAAIAAARQRLGSDAIIGASCYDQLSLAHQAVLAGADYVAFGAVFPSRIKPDARHAPLDLFRQARSALAVPICAIGGLTPANAPTVLAAGADMLAVISAVFNAPDCRVAAARFHSVFPQAGND
ncbi:thiamine phosphate synthase [Halothiobacillus sp.]|uniref:thiamine phosphate synthase n=1 Tax=Halothiobacillus sp. TaxID=1891311 RepID=UPI002AD1E4A0|nr:thiamine phosphate synthase [Halothiobacillus sp.]